MSHATKTMVAIALMVLTGPRALEAARSQSAEPAPRVLSLERASLPALSSTPSEDPARDVPCAALEDEATSALLVDELLALATRAVYAGRAHPDKDERKCHFRLAEDLARRFVFQDPGDPHSRYWYAAAMGLRAAEEGGRTQVSLAQRAHEQARLTLTLAPDHAGAQHVLGRLHAAVMRLGRIKRFVATQVLGGAVLAEASWESAEAYLSAAAQADPSVPEYHYELGALYLDTSRPRQALEAFEAALRCPRVFAADQLVQDVARASAERLQRQLAR